jgi:CheY-like chemotaxis protein
MERANIKTARVLVAVDKENVLDVTCEMLRVCGQEADRAATESEAVERYRRSLMLNVPYDLVFLAVPGPPERGSTIVQNLRDLDLGVRIIISHAQADEGLELWYQEQGVCGTIRKPYRLKELMRIVQDALEAEGVSD